MEDISSLGTLRWSLDFGEDSYILLDASRNHGSGSGDMYAYIPAANFADALPTDYVHMYRRFGDQVGATSEDGVRFAVGRRSVFRAASWRPAWL